MNRNWSPLHPWAPRECVALPQIVPLEAWEIEAVDRVIARLDDAGRWDCVHVIDGMSNAELHVLADHEGHQFRPVLWTEPAEVVDIATRHLQGVAARTSARYNGLGPACVNTRAPAHTCDEGEDVHQCTYGTPVVLVPLSSEAL